MAKIVCQTCGEVLAGVDEVDGNADGHELDNVEDLRSDQNSDEGDESDDSEDGGGDGAGGSGLSRADDLDELEDEVQDQFEDKLEEIDNSERQEQAADEAEQYSSAGHEQDIDIKVNIDSRYDADREHDWEQAKLDSRSLANEFKEIMRQKQRNDIRREEQNGRFDSRRMIQADRGSSRVFKREDEGDDLKYEAYFIVDRSGSMKGRDMVFAENAVATLALALEEAGIGTEIVDFKSNTPRVMKTKSQEPEEVDGNIIQGRYSAGGGTPLGAVAELMKGRLEGSEGDPFVIVITDGKPGDMDRYQSAIREMHVPVLGVEIGDEGYDTEENLFHHKVVVEDETELTNRLYDLARGIMF